MLSNYNSQKFFSNIVVLYAYILYFLLLRNKTHQTFIPHYFFNKKISLMYGMKETIHTYLRMWASTFCFIAAYVHMYMYDVYGSAYSTAMYVHMCICVYITYVRMCICMYIIYVCTYIANL